MALLHAILGLIMVGITLEVFWTSIIDSIKTKDPKLTGKTYLWMFPIYAISPFIFILILTYFPQLNFLLRGILYMLGFYILEFIAGYLIKKAVKISPWNYEHKTIKLFGKKYKSHLAGVVCLQYAPIWYLYGIIGEFYFKFLMGL